MGEKSDDSSSDDDSSSEESSSSNDQGDSKEKEDEGGSRKGGSSGDDEEEAEGDGDDKSNEGGQEEEDDRGAAQEEMLNDSPAKTKCIDEIDHDIKNLNMNDQVSYINEGERLFEMECDLCDKELTVGQEEAKAGTKSLFDRSHPVYCCAHQQKRMCDYLICHACYVEKLNMAKGRPRRNRPTTPGGGV